MTNEPSHSDLIRGLIGWYLHKPLSRAASEVEGERLTALLVELFAILEEDGTAMPLSAVCDLLGIVQQHLWEDKTSLPTLDPMGALSQWVDAGPEARSLLVTGIDNPVDFLPVQLSECSDVVPADYCDRLGLPSDTTCAEAVRWLDRLRREAELSRFLHRREEEIPF
ncbi:hypothetical protein ACFL51_01345 [Myxococcota bacterium]